MKKILCAVGLTLLIAGCSGDYTDWANPKTSAPEDAKTITVSVANAPDINFADIADVTTDSVQLFIPTVTTTGVSTSTYTAVLYAANGTDTINLSASTTGKVSAADLQAAVEKLYGKAPTPHAIPMDVIAYTNVNGQSILTTVGTQPIINVTLVAAPIDSGYYLAGDMFGWDAATAQPFVHEGTGTVYDTPVFGICFTTTDVNKYWKIVTATGVNNPTAFWDGSAGTALDGDPSLTGNLTTTNPQAGKIEAAGYYYMQINMLDYKYNITPVSGIGIVGDAAGSWDVDIDMTYNASTGAWETTATFGVGELKFRANHAWDLSWGGAAAGETVPVGQTVADLTAYNSQNLKLDTAGTYFVQLFLSYDGTNQLLLTPVPAGAKAHK